MSSQDQCNSKSMRIKVMENGPYVVTGNVPVEEQIIVTDASGEPTEWQKGRRYNLRETCILCRCGNSKTKPYCDGTHSVIGFDGAETAHPESYLNEPKEIAGPKLKLLDVEILCASARFCHREGGIWNLVPKSDDSHAAKIARQEACDCPSGRLMVQEQRSGKFLEPDFERCLGLIEDPAVGVSGPIWVRGGIQVVSSSGAAYRVRNRITLCRCGKSQNKPFCDSSHYPEEHEPHGEAST